MNIYKTKLILPEIKQYFANFDRLLIERDEDLVKIYVADYLITSSLMEHILYIKKKYELKMYIYLSGDSQVVVFK